MRRLWPFMRCCFCRRQRRRDRLFHGACRDCVRANLAWIAQIPTWCLTREVGT